MTFDYKKYSLENLEHWMHDAISSGGATPQEIYDVIVDVVKENYYTYKHQASQAYELLALLNGNGSLKIEDVLKEREYYEGWDEGTASNLVCDKDDPSPECKKSWSDFWEENYYPEESEQYTEEELNAMCEAAASQEEREKCREYNLREAEYYDKRALIDAQQDKVIKWILPVEEAKDADTGKTEYFVSFPDDLLEAANLKEGDQVQWIDNCDGSYSITKITQPLKMDER